MTDTKKIAFFLFCMSLFMGYPMSLFARGVQTSYTTDKAVHHITIGMGGGMA